MLLPRARCMHALIAIAVLFSIFTGFSVFAEEVVDFLTHKDRLEWVAGGFYEGRFADGTPFQMNLAYPTPKKINRKTGERYALDTSYWYPRRFAGETLNLTIKSFKPNYE